MKYRLARALVATGIESMEASAMWKILLTVCILWTMPWHWALAGPGSAGRMALVIGNADYRGAPRANPVRDAHAMADALKSLGFEVTRYTNLDQRRMREAIARFNRRLAATGGVGLFYFAGHGFRLADRTLLLPFDASSPSPTGLAGQSIDLDSVLAGMSAPRPGRVNLIVLDTCLDQAFGAGRGPAVPPQTLIAYATAPGSHAADGRRHGIYTAELLQALRSPGRDIAAVFRQVEAGVGRTTGMRQIPWVSSSLPGGFRLAGSPPPARAVPPSPSAEIVVALNSRGVVAAGSKAQDELAFWNSIKGSSRPEDYQSYLQAYPRGHFAALARGRIERLSEDAAKAEAPPAKPAVKPPRKRMPPAYAKARTPPKPASENPATADVAPPGKAAAQAQDLQELADCPDCPTMLELPRGLFTMGSDDGDAARKPSHSVALADVFAIAAEEISVVQWNACAAAGACPPLANEGAADDGEPVRNVSWDDAQHYVQWLSRRTGKSYRLPTEAEWEYAYEFLATDGGAREWVSDCWHDSYMGAPPDGSNWDEPGCRMRVVRSGASPQAAQSLRLPPRAKSEAGVRNPLNGFRVARDLP